MAAQISNKEDVVGVVFFVCKGLVKGCLKSAYCFAVCQVWLAQVSSCLDNVGMI